MSLLFQEHLSPVGILYLVAGDESLHALAMEGNWQRIREKFKNLTEGENSILKETRRQLDEYFKCKRKKFELPLQLSGTPFQNKVWRALLEIPYGQTRTYKNQASSIGSPAAVRATGRANGLNPISIVVPCHRVVGANGLFTGYAGGLSAKRFLLELEGQPCNDAAVAIRKPVSAHSSLLND